MNIKKVFYFMALIIAMIVFTPALSVANNINTDPKQQLPDPDAMPAAIDKPVKVFILLGQSNMLGFGKVTPEDKNGTLSYAIKTKKKYSHLVDDQGNWTERKDVRYVQVMHRRDQMSTLRNEWLTVKGNIGPELQFGHIMGHVLDEPVMVLKSCIGNRSLGWDLLPPGSKQFEFEGNIYAGYKESPLSWEKGTKPEPINWYAGKQYDDDIGNAKKVLANIGDYYPGAKNYEVAGFVWWQGHKDQNPAHASRYEQNLVHLIRTLRKDFNAPEAKFVIATIAFEGWDLKGPGLTVANAQLSVSSDKGKYPEFKGNVKTVEARDFWRPKEESPSAGYHYNHNAETYMEVSNLLGWAMAELLLNQAAIPDTRMREQNRIQPYLKNSAYWQYKGKPVLLLGGSKTDHIFLAEDLDNHLDEILLAGGNYVRNTMSQREGVELKPHKRLEDGTFYLDKWNDDYWKRFADCLKWCQERNIIIQIEVWDRFDFSQEHWEISPWRPINNVNYTTTQSGLANQYPIHPWRDKQPFFHSIAGMRDYKKPLDLVRKYQEKFVDKMLSYSLGYDNVLYCMNNETSTPPQWGLYWMNYIRHRAAEKNLKVCVTDMFDDVWKPHTSAKLKQAFNRPQEYDFIDISQVNSRSFNQDQWTNLEWIFINAQNHLRPLNNTKIYSDGQTTWGSGTPKDGVERFWRDIIAGSASCRFHRPVGGIGLNDVAKACIQAARKIESEVKLWDVAARQDLLSQREADEAYLAANPGKQYILFFTDGGQVKLDLRGKGTFKLHWVNISTGKWAGESQLTAGGKITISAPGQGPWAAAITRLQ